MVAAWRQDQPVPLFTPPTSNAVVIAQQRWSIGQDVYLVAPPAAGLRADFTYDPARLPADFDPANASLYRLDGKVWAAVPAVIDPLAHTLTTVSPTRAFRVDLWLLDAGGAAGVALSP